MTFEIAFSIMAEISSNFKQKKFSMDFFPVCPMSYFCVYKVILRQDNNFDISI